MAGRRSPARFAVPAMIGLVIVVTVWIFARPSHEPIVGHDPQRFAIDGATVRLRLATAWEGPIASGSGTRCWEARDADADWRLCEDPMGHLMTVSAGTPAFSDEAVRKLATVLHPDAADEYDAWRGALTAGPTVEACSTAGPFWRALVDGRVVVGSIGRCPPT